MVNLTKKSKKDLEYITTSSKLTDVDAINQAINISAELLRQVRKGYDVEIYDPFNNKRYHMEILRH